MHYNRIVGSGDPGHRYCITSSDLLTATSLGRSTGMVAANPSLSIRGADVFRTSRRILRFWKPRGFLATVDEKARHRLAHSSPEVAERLGKSHRVSRLVGAVVGASVDPTELDQWAQKQVWG